MLNESPKKQNSSEPTKWQYFWRIQKECWRRMVTPFLMYLFMSLLALACSALLNNVPVAAIVLEAFCILGGAFFNAHLCYNYGKMHYDAYLTGLMHRRNQLFGLESGGNYQKEKEFRPWKGFYIGFLVGVPVIIFGGFGHISRWMKLFLILFACWAWAPVSWAQEWQRSSMTGEAANTFTLSSLWSLFMVLLPILVSGIAYLIGAYVNKRNRELGKVEIPPQKKKKV